MNISLDDGKYTLLCNDDGSGLRALRHGEPWGRDLVGDQFVYALGCRIEALTEELETERIRLAACGVVALADTPASAIEARKMLPKYHSASCGDVERRVDECITLRGKLAAVTEQRDTAWALIASIRKDFEEDETFGQTVETLFAAPLVEAGEKLAAVTEQRDQLAAWKESTMAVSAQCDTQKAGTLLGVPLGADIYSAIEPGIRLLQGKLAIARMALDSITHDMGVNQNVHDLCAQALEQTRP